MTQPCMPGGMQQPRTPVLEAPHMTLLNSNVPPSPVLSRNASLRRSGPSTLVVPGNRSNSRRRSSRKLLKQLSAHLKENAEDLERTIDELLEATHTLARRRSARHAPTPQPENSATPVFARHPAYFHGNIPRIAAEERLTKSGLTDGLFLVREKTFGDEYAISSCFAGKVFHYLRKRMSPEG